MSYSRFIESDVYMYEHVGGWIECCWCALASEEEACAKFQTALEALDHLIAHQEAGHDVAPRAFDAVRAEIALTPEPARPAPLAHEDGP